MCTEGNQNVFTSFSPFVRLDTYMSNLQHEFSAARVLCILHDLVMAIVGVVLVVQTVAVRSHGWVRLVNNCSAFYSSRSCMLVCSMNTKHSAWLDDSSSTVQTALPL